MVYGIADSGGAIQETLKEELADQIQGGLEIDEKVSSSPPLLFPDGRC